jgi:hypothetical protein
MTPRSLAFSAANFLAAALLFCAQLIIARLLLPTFGGAPAAWNTAMVFYQVVLLLGYLWAHLLTHHLAPRWQLLAQALVLALPIAALPFALPSGAGLPPPEQPVTALLARLGLIAGAPLFAVSTLSPLLQRWFSVTGDPRHADPYFLYAASNLGSLLGLLAYPFAIEPRSTVPQQSFGWAVVYGALVVLSVGCGALSLRAPPAARPDAVVLAIPLRRQLRWGVLAAVPSSLLLSVTTYVSSDIGSAPLLWAVPLGLYLLTFVIAFSSRLRLPETGLRRALILALVPVAMALAAELTEPIALLTALHLAAFFVAALVCHSVLARDRPDAGDLTRFYLWVSLGGALGGAFTALLAPVLFDRVLEYPLVLVGAAYLGAPDDAAPFRRRDLLYPVGLGALTAGLALVFQVDQRSPSPAVLALAFGVPSVGCFFLSRHRLRFALSLGAVLLVGQSFAAGQGRVVWAARSFFGVHRVTRDGRFHRLLHGHTVHGVQDLDASRAAEPLGYYGRQGPLGQIFAALALVPDEPIAAIGLGAGAVAAYGAPHQPITFYEIDPVVREIATDARFFRYLPNAAASVTVVLGDARRSLETAPDGAYRLMILDAYSSDAVPVHLLTREAVELYLRKLKPGGVLAFHISNRHLKLEPVVARLAKDRGLVIRVAEVEAVSEEERGAGWLPSQWAAVARDPSDLRELLRSTHWREPEDDGEVKVWTDDFSSLLQVLDL